MEDGLAIAGRILDEHRAVAQRTRDELLPAIVELADAAAGTIERGGKLLIFGNGGSAADAQHFAAELIGHFTVDHRPLPAIALTTDSSALTAIGNDYGLAEIFARQVAALALPGDLALGISTSGRAENVIRGIEAAGARGVTTWALTGGSGGRLREVAGCSIVIPSTETGHIQEMHITLIHTVCALLDARLAAAEDGAIP